MMNAFVFALMTVFTVLGATLGAASSAQAQIILPDPASYSELSSFQPEWCGTNTVETGSVKAVCYGSVLFQNFKTVRAVKLNQDVYFEASWPSIELLALKFDVIGPMGETLISETGRVVLQIDGDGNVIAIKGATPRHGTFLALKPQP